MHIGMQCMQPELGRLLRGYGVDVAAGNKRRKSLHMNHMKSSLSRSGPLPMDIGYAACLMCSRLHDSVMRLRDLCPRLCDSDMRLRDSEYRLRDLVMRLRDVG